MCVVVVVVREAGSRWRCCREPWFDALWLWSSPARSEHETNIRPTTDNAALSIIPFFIDVNGLFTTNSSQVASADVLGQQILSFRRE